MRAKQAEIKKQEAAAQSVAQGNATASQPMQRAPAKLTPQQAAYLGVPVTGTEPPTDTVMPPMPEMARLFARYGAEILGPPPSLGDLS